MLVLLLRKDYGTMLKIIIVDDHEFFRKTLKDYLLGMDKVVIAGEAGNGKEAVELVKNLLPQLVLMDIQMPELDGIKACEIIKQIMPKTIVILYTGHDIEICGREGMTLANRCLPKDRLFDEIPAIIGKMEEKVKN